VDIHEAESLFQLENDAAAHHCPTVLCQANTGWGQHEELVVYHP